MVEKAYQRLGSIKGMLKKGLLGGVFLLGVLFPCKAQEIRLISDEETESFLADIVKPLFEAAGVKFYRNNIFIVDDNSLNAFVSDKNKLFVHTGTIIKADSADEISGVLAHETGHIAGGHILRQKLKNKDMYEISLASAILAGTAAALSGRGDAAMAVMMGGQSSLLNHYMKYRTEEERTADETAVKLLNKTQKSPAGILKFMKKIRQENFMSGREEIPYFRTHPVTGERIAFFEKAAEETSYKIGQSDERFERIKAKLKAYLQAPEQTFNQYPENDKSIVAQYAQAIAYMKKLDFTNALNKTDALLKLEPENPYFHEIKGQLLLETGNISKAKQHFAMAYKLNPDSHLMQINYAQVLLEDNPDKTAANKAIDLLNKALVRSQNGFVWILLAKAYGVVGDMAAANYASAEYSLKIKNVEAAKKQIKNAAKYPASKQIKLKIADLDKRLKARDKQLVEFK